MAGDADPFDLQRFVEAQATVYARVGAELRAGRKTSHWMWFVFPQLAGLGHSTMAARYAIRSRDEARAYLAHAVLGPRLRECTGLVLGAGGLNAYDIFGNPDELKFHSSMTLFAVVADAPEIFDAALTKYFGSQRDAATLELL